MISIDDFPTHTVETGIVKFPPFDSIEISVDSSPVFVGETVTSISPLSNSNSVFEVFNQSSSTEITPLTRPSAERSSFIVLDLFIVTSPKSNFPGLMTSVEVIGTYWNETGIVELPPFVEMMILQL